MHELSEGALVTAFCYPEGTDEGPGIVRMQRGEMSMVPWIESRHNGRLHNCKHLAWVKLAEKSSCD